MDEKDLYKNEYVLQENKSEQNQSNKILLSSTLIVAVVFIIYTLIKKNEDYKPNGSEALNRELINRICKNIAEKCKDYIQEFINGKINIYDFCKHYNINIKTTNEVNDDCILCYSNDEDQIITKCNHTYCISCLLTLMKQQQINDKCVYCKQKINLTECTVVVKENT